MIPYLVAGVVLVAAMGKKVTTLATPSKSNFKTKFLDAATRVNLQGIPPKWALSMAALETGWGTGKVFQNTNNLFSITAGSTWRGPTYKASTGFVFRMYSTWEESILDYVRLVSTSKRYSKAYSAALTGPSTKFFEEIQRTGYAGDDYQYASKLGRTLEVLA